MRVVMIITLLLHSVISIYSRDVVAIAGASVSSGNVTYSWTLGESVVSTLNYKGTYLTQGFQQPIGKASQSSSAYKPRNMSKFKHLEFSMFPIPTYGNTTLKVSTTNDTEFKVTVDIVNVKGMKVYSFNTSTEVNRVDLSKIYPGTYIVNYIDFKSKELIKVSRIIKL